MRGHCRSRTGCLRIKLRNRFNHPALFARRQLWKHRQREYLSGSTLRFEQISLPVTEIGKKGLQMKPDRIVDLGRDVPLRKESPQLVPAQRADHILMKHMVRVLRHSWERDGSAGATQSRLGKQTMVGRSARTPLLVPRLDMFQLHA